MDIPDQEQSVQLRQQLKLLLSVKQMRNMERSLDVHLGADKWEDQIA